MARQTRIKICGITRVEDGVEAARLGADAIGLVFYEPSPRAVTIEQAIPVCSALPPFLTTIALFVDAEPDYVKSVIEALPINILQFHGNETPEYCMQFGLPYIKAIRMEPELDVHEQIANYSNAAGILLDAYSPAAPGGTGEVFDWSRVPLETERPIILAGGLTPENVVEAIKITEPYAVDVSGGVESAKGIKSAEKMAEFVSAVRNLRLI